MESTVLFCQYALGHILESKEELNYLNAQKSR